MQKYRELASKHATAEPLQNLLTSLQKEYILEAATRKKPPRGLENTSYPALLLHEGLVILHKTAHPKEINSTEFLDHCLQHFAKMSALNQWFAEIN